MNETAQMGGVGHGEVELPILNQLNKKDLNIIDKIEDPRIILNELRSKNRDKIMSGHININFIENKFEALVSLIRDRVDIMMISETKIDDSFPQNQFLIEMLRVGAYSFT